MTWYAVLDETGALQSSGETVAEELPEGWTTQELPDPPAEQGWYVDSARLEWKEAPKPTFPEPQPADPPADPAA